MTAGQTTLSKPSPSFSELWALTGEEILERTLGPEALEWHRQRTESVRTQTAKVARRILRVTMLASIVCRSPDTIARLMRWLFRCAEAYQSGKHERSFALRFYWIQVRLWWRHELLRVVQKRPRFVSIAFQREQAAVLAASNSAEPELAELRGLLAELRPGEVPPPHLN